MSLDIEEVVRPGDKIAIVPYVSGDEADKTYVSKVFDFTDDGNIEVLMPMEGTKIVLLPVGAEFDATFYAKKGMYGCRIKVAARFKEDNLFILSFVQVTDLEKLQRREFYRFDCVVGMNSCEVLKDDVDKFDETGLLNFMPEPEGKCVIIDISGGGMRFISSEHYEPGRYLRIKFILPGKNAPRKFDLLFLLIAERPAPNNPKNTEYRGKFYHISNQDQDEIVKYIFEQERLHRKSN